ncbi:MAG: quinol-cytochrome oxidoreductase complex cytochrome b subunit [Reinekea sp.]|jgi:quinol-cytochrome oxidoreductase complex cytochrome b subunit
MFIVVEAILLSIVEIFLVKWCFRSLRINPSKSLFLGLATFIVALYIVLNVLGYSQQSSSYTFTFQLTYLSFYAAILVSGLNKLISLCYKKSDVEKQR